MKLNPEEQAMLNGEMGEPRRWAIEHMMRVGRFFDAEDSTLAARICEFTIRQQNSCTIGDPYSGIFPGEIEWRPDCLCEWHCRIPVPHKQ